MQLWSQWSIGGIVTERRELTSKKNESWRGYVVSVAGLGQTFEINVTKEQFDELADGQHVHLTGEFENQRGASGSFLRLVLKHISDEMPEETPNPLALSKRGAA
ncbi:MAG: hypothetical protein AAFQ17_01160 [Pseudomonadota bacterium]